MQGGALEATFLPRESGSGGEFDEAECTGAR